MKRKDQPGGAARATSFMPAARAVGALVLLATAANAAPRVEYVVVATHPHDATLFTQGLAIVEGQLVESGGGFGRSRIVVRALRDGKPRRQAELPREVFAEGIAYDGTRLVQLTWRSGFAALWDLSLNPRGRYSYSGEGWGLAWDGARWLMSDGSDRIQRRSRGFEHEGSFAVTDGGRAITRLNELEYARGVLFANVWHADSIAAIDPDTGRVIAWLELAALKQGFMKPTGWNAAEHVLNGVAFDPQSGHLFVTGKCWPVLYELQLAQWPQAERGPKR